MKVAIRSTCWCLFTGIHGSDSVRPATRILHETLIRLMKGMVHAYEAWLKTTLNEEKHKVE
jgi:hypothetical protein